MLHWMRSIRSIVTLLLTLTYGYLCVTGKIDPKDIQTTFSILVVFYFTRKRIEDK